MGVPPFDVDAVYATVAVVPLVGVAVPIVGALGTVVGVTEFVTELAGLVPTKLVAVIVNVYVVPPVKPETAIVPVPA